VDFNVQRPCLSSVKVARIDHGAIAERTGRLGYDEFDLGVELDVVPGRHAGAGNRNLPRHWIESRLLVHADDVVDIRRGQAERLDCTLKTSMAGVEPGNAIAALHRLGAARTADEMVVELTASRVGPDCVLDAGRQGPEP